MLESDLEKRDKRLLEISESKQAIIHDEDWLDKWYLLEKEERELWRDFPDPPPDKPIEVKEVNSGGGACPTQFFGINFDGQEVYARYRHGYLSVEVGGDCVFGKQLDWGTDENHSIEHYLEMWHGDKERAEQFFKSNEMILKLSGGYHSYNGVLTYEQLKEATEGWLIWPIFDF